MPRAVGSALPSFTKTIIISSINRADFQFVLLFTGQPATVIHKFWPALLPPRQFPAPPRTGNVPGLDQHPSVHPSVCLSVSLSASVSVALRRRSAIKSFQSLNETRTAIADNLPITSLPARCYLPASSSSSSSLLSTSASAARLVSYIIHCVRAGFLYDSLAL